MLRMLQVGWSSTVDIHNILLGKHHVLYTLRVDVCLRDILRGLCVCTCVFEREAQRDGTLYRRIMYAKKFRHTYLRVVISVILSALSVLHEAIHVVLETGRDVARL